MTTHRALYTVFGQTVSADVCTIARAERWTLTKGGETKYLPNHPAYRIALLEELNTGWKLWNDDESMIGNTDSAPPAHTGVRSEQRDR